MRSLPSGALLACLSESRSVMEILSVTDALISGFPCHQMFVLVQFRQAEKVVGIIRYQFSRYKIRERTSTRMSRLMMKKSNCSKVAKAVSSKSGFFCES